MGEMAKIAVVIFIGISISLTGCATIITGTYQKVDISSDPSGAAVQVDGKDNYTTPVKVKLDRSSDHTLFFTREGYNSQTIKLLHVISGAFCGNILLWGPLGMGFDALTGAEYKLIPEKVHVTMEKEREHE